MNDIQLSAPQYFLFSFGPADDRLASAAQAQDKIQIAYSSTDTLNQLWTIPHETGFYKKNGLDVDMVYIGSTTVGISAIVAQDISIGNAAGSGVANANVRGADTVSVGCMINVLAYELVVLDSIKSRKTSRENRSASVVSAAFPTSPRGSC